MRYEFHPDAFTEYEGASRSGLTFVINNWAQSENPKLLFWRVAF